MFAGLGAAGYVGGFVGFNVKTKGLSGTEALPHPAFWLELKALVQDGAAFAVAKAKELQKGGGAGGSSAGKEKLVGPDAAATDDDVASEHCADGVEGAAPA
eukprot:SAG31_NODE_16531_length_705_cov_1.189769_1_plen_100_part_01